METTGLQQAMRALTHEERLEAKQIAAQNLAGKRPERKAFEHHTQSKYPPETQRTILWLAGIVLFAAFATSAIRLYDAGYRTFYESMPDHISAVIAGIAVVLLAESGQIVFSIALVTMEARGRAAWILNGGAALSTVIALVGNVTTAQPLQADAMHGAFAWLEALVPPVLVLGVAYVLKGRLLEGVLLRHADNEAYAAAVLDWEQKLAGAEQHAAWGRFYVHALRDALMRANARGKARDARNMLDDNAWRALILRELRSETAFTSLYGAVQEQEQLAQAQDRLAERRKRQEDAATQAEQGDAPQAEPRITEFSEAVEPHDGMWLATCPYCKTVFEKSTENAARMALVAHKRGCVVAKRMQEVQQESTELALLSSNGHNGVH